MTVRPLVDFVGGITIDDLERDPYPIYARLRAEAPVAYIPAIDLWLVTRWADVEYVGTHPEIFSAELADTPIDASFGAPTIITADGEVHADLRRSLDAKYRPRNVNNYIDDLVGPIVNECLAELEGRGRADLLTEYFEPISVRSLGQVLGLGQFSADVLRRWFRGLSQGAINFERDPARQAINDVTAAEIDTELAPILARLIETPDDSTLSHMLRSGRPAGELRPIEAIMPSLKVIILGGMQEPGHGAATALYGLLSSGVEPAPELAPAAVDEGLRWISPIGTQTREVHRSFSLSGVQLPVGARVGSVIASANRDESVYADADQFQLGRAKRPHAAYGFGVHFCAGHAFARGQMTIAVRRLLETFPSLRLDESQPVNFQGWEFRAPTSLPVRLK